MTTLHTMMAPQPRASTSSRRRSSAVRPSPYMRSLPASHFLSLPPTHFSSIHPSHPPTLSHLSAGLAPNTATTAAADFDVDVRTGFLPAVAPVERLEGAYEVWERALDAARGPGRALRLGGGERETLWRRGICEMPVIPTDALRASVPDLRRAHLVLTFLMHFFVHSHAVRPTPRTDPLGIPASISVPLLEISPLLGLPPILTYSDTVLYNSHPTDPSLAPNLSSNPLVTSLETFTNTPDEAHFYLTSARCEIAGVHALDLMRRAMDEAFVADSLALTRLTGYLRELASQIDLVGDIILDVTRACRPEVFYHVIRPWFRGGDMDGPGSAGWLFEGLDRDAQERLVGGSGAEHRRAGQTVVGRTFSGPSAGQSTLIHAFDVFLMVDHRAKEEANEGAGDGGDAAAPPPSSEDTFMERMKAYMPHPHRAFLNHLADAPHPIRGLVLRHAARRPDLAHAYDEALAALKRLRDKHMRVVSLYIVQQARRPASAEMVALGAPAPPAAAEAPDDVAVEGLTRRLAQGSLSDLIAEQERNDEELRGTGGTALIKFLKMCRDNTTRTMVGGRV